jgi:hypothetical protein
MKQFSLETQTWVDTPEPPVPEDALDYLRQVYRGTIEADPWRLKAASIAIEYERPRLAVIARVGDDFAERLGRCIERSQKVVNGSAKPPVIEAAPRGEPQASADGPGSPLSPSSLARARSSSPLCAGNR